MSSDPPRDPNGDQAGRPKRRMVGKFEVLEQIGRGAMGAVFRARQVSVDRVVALKILPPNLAQSKDYTARFLREGKAAAHLNHPNIVQAIVAGKAGVYYYIFCPLSPPAGFPRQVLRSPPEERRKG
ncbi:MAG: protein kinase, partial [Planctomycetota bacterium]